MTLFRSPLTWLVALLLLAGAAVPSAALADGPDDGYSLDVYNDTVSSSMPTLLPGVYSIDRVSCIFDGVSAGWKTTNLTYAIFGGELYSADVTRSIASSFGEWVKAGAPQTFREVKGGTTGDITVLIYPIVTQLFGAGTLAATGTLCVNGTDGIQQAIIYVGVSINSSVINLTEVQNVVAHEVGHALGLGHANNPADLMFPFINPTTATSRVICPSTLDLAGLASRSSIVSASVASYRELPC